MTVRLHTESYNPNKPKRVSDKCKANPHRTRLLISASIATEKGAVFHGSPLGS